MPLFTTPERTQQVGSGFSPEQQQAFSQLLQGGMGGLQNLLGGIGQNNFAPIRQEATRRFEQETVPSLAERFIGMGEGALQSSGFQQALGQAGAGLQSQLGALEAQFGQQQRGQDINLIKDLLATGLSPQFQEQVIPKERGSLPALGTQLGGGLMGLAPALMASGVGMPIGLGVGGLGALLSLLGALGS